MKALVRNKINALVAFIFIFLVSYFQAATLKKQIVINSDSLYMHDLSQDLLSGGSILNWSLTQAPDYFPHMIVYLFISLFSKSATTQLFLITLFQIISLCTLLYIIFRELGQRIYSSVLQSIGLLTIISLFQLHSTDWIYFYKTNNHFSSITMGLLALFFLLRSLNCKKIPEKRMLFAISVTVFLGTLSTITFIYAISIPIFLVLLAKMREIQRSQHAEFLKSTVISWLIILPVSTISSLLVTVSNENNGGLPGRLNISNIDILKVQNLTLAAFSRNLLSSGAVIRIISLLLICICFISLVLFLFLRSDILFNLAHDSNLFTLFQISVSSLLSSSILTVLSAGIVDEYFLRYFWPSLIMLLIFFSVICVNIFRNFQKTIYRKLHFEICLISFLVIVFGIMPGSIQSQESQFQKVAKCLTDKRSEGVKLRSGVADYWYGRSVDYLSSNPSRTFVALNSLDPFYWMTTNSYYNPKAEYNFILLHTQPDQFNFNFESMKGFLPLPSRKFSCEGTDIEIYFYNNNSLDRIVRSAIRKFSSLNQAG